MNETLQSDIRSADPVTSSEDTKLRELVRAMAAEARQASQSESSARTPWWRRRRTVIPLGALGVAALTGAAVMVPLGLGVNGTQVELDAVIPISYTTDNGIDVNCRYGLYFGDPVDRTAADEHLAEFVASHDWTGIGQRIYDRAIAHPFVPGPDDHWEVDDQEGRDNFSFRRALSLIWAEIPTELQQDGQSAAATSDCTGQLR